MKYIKASVAMGAGAALLVALLVGAAHTATAQTVSSYPNIFTGRDMTIGSTGQDVALLQGLLSELGYLQVPAGVPLGYYGTLTESALARYQQSIGVINTGYFGPLTKIAMGSAFSARGWLNLLYPTVYSR